MAASDKSGGGGVRRRHVALVTSTFTGRVRLELIDIGGGGDEHGAEAIQVVFCRRSLCPDINFMFAILGQNTKYGF
jgi:hypothetical protein